MERKTTERTRMTVETLYQKCENLNGLSYIRLYTELGRLIYTATFRTLPDKFYYFPVLSFRFTDDGVNVYTPS